MGFKRRVWVVALLLAVAAGVWGDAPVRVVVRTSRGYTVYRDAYTVRWSTTGSGENTENTKYTRQTSAITETTVYDGGGSSTREVQAATSDVYDYDPGYESYPTTIPYDRVQIERVESEYETVTVTNSIAVSGLNDGSSLDGLIVLVESDVEDLPALAKGGAAVAAGEFDEAVVVEQLQQENAGEENDGNGEADTASETGDPVLVGSGQFTTSINDLVLDLFRLSRVYRSDARVEGSLGPGWWTSIDSRIVFGVSSGAAALADRAAETADALRTPLSAYRSEYESERARLVGELDSLLATLTAERDRIRQSISALDAFSYSGPGASEVRLEVADALAQTRALDSSITARISEVQGAKSALLGALTTEALAEFEAAALVLDAEAALQARRAERASFRDERNTRFALSAVPPEVFDSGNGSLTVYGADGAPLRFTYAGEPDLESALRYSDGSRNYYPAGSTLVAQRHAPERLRLLPDGRYVLTLKDGVSWHYGADGQLLEITDRNGNHVRFTYRAGGLIDGFTDSRGRAFEVVRDSAGRITEVRGPGEFEIHYAYDAAGRLTSVTDEVEDTVTYRYHGASQRLWRIEKPDGSYREYTYAFVLGSWRVTETRDETRAMETFSYTADTTTFTNPSGLETVHHVRADFKDSRTDHPGGLAEQFAYNAAGDRTWHLATDGTETGFAWDERHNLLRVDYEDRSAESWTYNAFDLPESYTDRAEQVTDYTYDSRGNLIRVDYPDGSADRFSYLSGGSAAGQVETHTTRVGNLIRYRYDSRGYLSEVTDSVGLVARYTNDDWGRPLAVTNGEGETTTYTYRPDGRVATIRGPEGLAVDYTYDNRKDLVRVVENGRPTSFTYDDRHLLLEVENALGERVVYEYRDDGKMAAKVLQSAPGLGGPGPEGRYGSRTEYHYNERGLLYQEIQVETGITTAYEYDDAGRVAAFTDPGGTRTELEYRFDGLPTSRAEILEGRELTEYFTYAADGLLTGHTDETGVVRSWDHDRARNTVTLRDGLGRVVRTTQENPYGQRLVEIDADGISTERHYDLRGRLTEVRVAGRVTEAYTYDLADRLTSFTDGTGATARYGYDRRGRLTTITHPDGAERLVAYNPDGTVREETDETGLATRYTYDAIGRLIARHDPGLSERTTTYQWHYTGALAAVTDPTGRTTRYQIDAAGRVTGLIDPAGAFTSYDLDPAGRLLEEVDASGRSRSFVYDDLGRLTHRYRGGELELSLAYDEAGRLTSETDGTGRSHRYSYNGLGQLEREENRGRAAKHYEYSVAGRLSQVTDYTGTVSTYAYDREGRLTGIDYSDGSFLAYAYDGAGRVTEQRNESERLSYTFDARGRLAEARAAVSGMDLSYSYDEAGRRTLAVDRAAGTATRWEYDERGFLAEIDDSTAGRTTFGYDAAGRRTLTASPNGVESSVRYDAAGRVQATVVRDAGGSVLDGLAHVYDPAGRRLYDITHEADITGYQYNDQGRLVQVQYPFSGPKREHDYQSFAELGVVPALPEGITPGPAHAAGGGTRFQDYIDITPAAAAELAEAYRQIQGLIKAAPQLHGQVWTERFDYDAAGNRSEWRTGWGRVTYTYDTAGRLEQAGVSTYDYDMAGNLAQRQTASGTTTYTYTAQHRLLVAETSEAVVGYAYDAAGRRIMRTEVATAPSDGQRPLHKTPAAGGAHRSLYRYDGDSRMVSSRVEMELAGVAEGEGLVKPVNPGGGRYRPAPAAVPGGTTAVGRSTFSEVSVGRRTLSVTGPEGSRFLSHDVLGSVRVATTGGGQVGETYRYDAYGQTLSGETSHHQPYGYNGKPRDPATGLTNYGFRDYLPEAGRFVTVDPIKDGVNWYAYVNADPVNFVDAWGLEAAPPGTGSVPDADPFRNPGQGSDVLLTAFGQGESQDFGSVYTGQRAQSPVRFPNSVSPVTPTVPLPEPLVPEVPVNLWPAADARIPQRYSRSNQCDDWMFDVIEASGVDANRFFAGDPQYHNVDQHIEHNRRAENAVDSMEPGNSYLLLMTDPANPQWAPHAAGATVHEDGSATAYEQSSTPNQSQFFNYPDSQAVLDAFSNYETILIIPITQSRE